MALYSSCIAAAQHSFCPSQSCSTSPCCRVQPTNDEGLYLLRRVVPVPSKMPSPAVLGGHTACQMHSRSMLKPMKYVQKHFIKVNRAVDHHHPALSRTTAEILTMTERSLSLRDTHTKHLPTFNPTKKKFASLRYILAIMCELGTKTVFFSGPQHL